MPEAQLFKRMSRYAALLAGLAVASSCAPLRNPALENARADYEKAQEDPIIVRHASAALEKAARALEEADQRWTGRPWARDADIIEVEHLAYLAEKKVAVARAIAQRRIALEEIHQMRPRHENTLRAPERDFPSPLP
jgi:OmpA-OmpF porin, OOP family